MMEITTKPLVVEPNFEVILEVQTPGFKEAREAIAGFCNLLKSPARYFTYIIDTVSLWNGFATGIDDRTIITILNQYARYTVPENVVKFIQKKYQSFGVFSLENYDSDHHLLVINQSLQKKNSPTSFTVKQSTESLMSEVLANKAIKGMWKMHNNDILIPANSKNIFKSELAQQGYIVNDFTDFVDGDPMLLGFKASFSLRDYQHEAVASFLTRSLIDRGGAGTVIMPCGSGKTMVGIGIMEKLKTSTLIIAPNLVSLRQWKKELIEKTDIDPDDIGEYSSIEKNLQLITLTTYQLISYRENESTNFKHIGIFKQRNWGLIIYDEIHMLPADIFRYATGIESKRKLGLTATLVREDGREKEVFSLVGPKKYDLPWKELEQINFLAKVKCYEIKVAMDPVTERNYYTTLSERERYRIAAENSTKFIWVEKILTHFPEASILIIGQFLEQLEALVNHLRPRFKELGDIPMLTGKTPQNERLTVYDQFRNHEVQVLVVSKIANFALDLPNADIAIQISGTYGSRQEEAQRLGRIIRPKQDGINEAFFFTLTSQNTREEFLAQNRKGFLVSQGYQYAQVVNDRELLEELS